MENNVNIEFAFNLGVEFATELQHSADVDNWHKMRVNDEIPDGDHCIMRDYYNYSNLDQK